jgi:bifunctional ADP-heptose synthase (sugar kinase/adenylyltransferase)
MVKIKIIGESSIDKFVYCEATRLAPDLPVPVLQELRFETNPGMAANVFRNVKSLISDVELITNPNWKELTKTRYVHEESNHTFLRVDRVVEIVPANLGDLNLESEVLVIADYNKGYLSETVIEQISNLHRLVFLDTKKVLGAWAEKCAFIKINNHEYLKSEKSITPSLYSKLIVTKGAQGCDYQGVSYPVEKVDVRDTSGAGDSFMAALVCEFSRCSDIHQSMIAANHAASKVVKTRGVGVI